jgi:hypothetical protein
MTTTDNEPRPAQVGDTIHVLCGGVLVLGLALRRGHSLVLTEEDIAGTRDRLGDSWCDDLSDAGQLARWGDIRFGFGPFPADLLPYVPGSRDHTEARERARKSAHRLADPQAKAEALAEVTRRFGDAPTSTTINAAADPSASRADEQRRRLDAEGVRSRSTYVPTERVNP